MFQSTPIELTSQSSSIEALVELAEEGDDQEDSQLSFLDNF